MQNNPMSLPGDFQPTREAENLKQQMLQFQQEVGQLRQMAQEARKRSLEAIKKGMMNNTNGLEIHQNAINDNSMANSPKKKPQSNQSAQPADPNPLSTGAQALQYTDQEMSKLMSKMQSQVEKSMQAAMDATSESSRLIAATMKQNENTLNAQVSGQPKEANAQQAAPPPPPTKEEQVLSEMEKAQKAVAAAIGNVNPNPPAEHQK